MKTILLFVLGLLGWLLITNYQVVYSKVLTLTNPDQDVPELVAEVESSTNTASEITSESSHSSEEQNNAKEKTDTLDIQLTENTTVTEDKIVSDDVGSMLSDEVAGELGGELDKELEENSDTANTTGLTPEAVNEDKAVAESNKDNKEIESEPEIEQKSNTEDTASNNAATSENTINPGMQQPQSSNMGLPHYNQNLMNPAMMNPGMFMNPMAMMMSMMGPMMNPAMMMNPTAMLNHPINTMTHPQHMNSMMMSMNPNMMFSMFGQPSKEYLEGEVPDQLPVITIPGMPTQTFQNWPANKVSPGVSREAKKNAFQTAMAISPLSMRDMMGIMADKMPVEEGVSWDDAIEAMKLRANEVNFKFVGSSKLWKEIEAVTGKPSAKVEMFRFCDAAVARRILDVVPEFIIFLPCKIALMEDGEGKLWVMTMDWDVNWLDYSQNPNSHLAKNIRDDAHKIRENMRYIMEGAATGDF